MDWIKRSTDAEEKADIGSVVAWQCVANTLNELVRHFHTITAPNADAKYQRYREIQIKKLITSMLYEAVDCIEKWAGKLHRAGLFDQKLKEMKEEFETRCKVIGLNTLKLIRNAAAFHFTDLIADGDAVVDVYARPAWVLAEELGEVVRRQLAGAHVRRHEIQERLAVPAIPIEGAWRRVMLGPLKE
jgi:hypothetical protein